MRAVSFHPAILSVHGPLTVRAVFERAWHLHDESGAVVTVTTTPYDGPMAVRVEGFLPAIRPGVRARFEGRTLMAGPVSIDLSGAWEWNGEREGMPPVHAAMLERDLERIGALAYVENPLIAARIAALGEALRLGEESGLRVAVRGLIGLGPGLTPAGDDVLCGAMVGLWVFERRLSRDGGLRAKALGYAGNGDAVSWNAEQLSAVVSEEMGSRTTALSRTLLFWAGRGVAAQPLLDVLWILGSGEPLEGLETVAAIGHTSGRDMLAGAALAAASVLGGQDDAPLVRAAQHLP